MSNWQSTTCSANSQKFYVFQEYPNERPHVLFALFKESFWVCTKKENYLLLPFWYFILTIEKFISMFLLPLLCFTYSDNLFIQILERWTQLPESYIWKWKCAYSVHLDSHPLEIRSAHGQQKHSCVTLRQNLSYLFLCCLGNEWLCMPLVAQSCLTLCDPMDYSLPGSLIHGDFSGKNTGMGCMLSFRRSLQPRDGNQFCHIAGRFLTVWATEFA